MSKLGKFAAACAAVLCAFGAFGDVFLKPLGPDETREVQDGQTWATAYATVADAIAGANDGDTIRAAKGVYVISSKITVGSKALGIFGGYPGVDGEDPLAGRDIAANPTIFTGDQTRDDVWQRVKPVLGEFRFDTEDTETTVITSAGEISDPGAYTDKFGGFAAKIVGTNTDGAFIVGNKAFELNGLTMTGFTGTSSGCILKCTPAKDVRYAFTDCVFTGNRSTQAMFTFSGTAGNQISFTRCTFSHDYSSATIGNTANIVWGESGYTFRDCTFLSCILYGSAWGNIALFRAGNIAMYDSAFTRCHMIRPSNCAVQAGEGNVTAPWAINTTTISNCFFTLCYTGTARTGAGVPLVCVSKAIPGPSGLNGNVFFDNRVESNPSANSTTSLFDSRSGNVGFENCAFVSNTVAAVSPSGDSGKYLLATVGFNTASTRPQVVNTTFDSNRILAPSSGLTVVKCRGVAASGFAASESGRTGIGYCTFYGPDEPDVYDIAQAGAYYPYEFLVVNTVVMSAATRANAFYADNPVKFRLSNVTIKNHVPIEGMRYYTGLETDEIPLVRSEGPIVPGTMPHFTPAARTPNIRTCDYFQNGDPGYYIFKGNLSDEVYQGWTLLLPNCSWRLPKSGCLAYDAVGNARSATDTMRGAVNAYADDAGSKLALVIRCEPLASGSVSPEGGTRAVAVGGSVSVTAVPAEGCKFMGWYTTDGEPYGSSPTEPVLSIAALEADLTLVAKFAADDVDLTFDLDGAGAFVEGGGSTKTVSAQPNTAFPGVPAYTESDDWVIQGWTPSLPNEVPAKSTTYKAVKFTKALRIIRVVPSDEAGETQDGTTWATAYGDLATAIADAGRYRGEVWIKKGTYRLSSSIAIKSNVAIRGGFAGAAEGEAPDPSANVTIISGDVKGDNKWTDGSTDFVWQEGSYNAPRLTDTWWRATGNNSDDLANGFTTSEVATNVVFAGLTFTGFRNSVVYSTDGRCDDLLVTNCVFCANGTEGGNVNAALYISGSRIAVVDSRFSGNNHGILIGGTTQARVVNTRFDGNSSLSGGAAIYLQGSSQLAVTNCDFIEGWAKADGCRCGSALGFYSGYSATIDNCRFLRNQQRSGGMGVIVPFSGNTVKITRSRFVGNNAVVPNPFQSRYGGLLTQDGGTLRVFDCEISENTNRVSATGGNGIGGLVAGNGTIVFVNTTFDRNVHTVDDPASAPLNAPFLEEGGTFALVNCMVNGTAIDAGVPEVKVTGGSVAAINTVFENDAAGYVSFAATGASSVFLSHGFVRNLDPATVTVGTYGSITNVAMSGEMRLSRVKQVDAYGNAHRGALPLDRGRNVWLSGTVPYFHDPLVNKSKPWRRADDLTSFAASVTGLTVDSPVLPDALGKARRNNHMKLGPVIVKSGLTVIVR